MKGSNQPDESEESLESYSKTDESNEPANLATVLRQETIKIITTTLVATQKYL